MYLKRLTVENFGSIIRFDARFPETFALIETPDSHSLISAVRILLLYSPLREVDPPVTAGQRAKLYARVVVGGLEYQVSSKGVKISALRVNKDGTLKEAAGEYVSAMSRCREENRISCFDGSDNLTDFGLERYEAEERFYRKGEFARVTDGMGTTRSFRRRLKDYLDQRSVAASDTDSDAIRFIDTVCFWDDFGKMRDLHYEGKPLLIKDASPDTVRSIREYDGRIERQKLLITRR